MANKFFRLTAAFLLFSLTIFAPVWAQEEPASPSLANDSETMVDLSDAESAPAGEAVPAEEAAPVPKSEDHRDSRYEISAIEDAAEGKNYYITRDENNNFSFVQKLSWNKIPDIKNYRITIERLSDDGWIQVMEKDLFENKIELSLEAGKYRFQVSVINLFDQLEKSSGWQHFEVLKALQPGIDNLQTDSLYLSSKKASGTFTLNGKNLNDKTIFTMEKKDCVPPKILYGKVLSLADDGSSAQVQFDISQVDEGKYEIYAQNPGGLSVISKTVTIKNFRDKNWRLMASAGYALPVSVMKGPLDHYAESMVFPISAAARLSLISFYTKVGDFGFNAGVNYSFVKAETKNYTLTGSLLTAMGGLTWQKYLIPKKLIIDVHAQAGIASFMNTSFENKYTGQKSPGLYAMGLAFGGGLGVQYNFVKHLYVEGNVDFVYAKFSDMSLGLVYPSVGIGGMF